MAINFPNSPSLDQIFNDVSTGNLYIWKGSVWLGYGNVSTVDLTLVSGWQENNIGIHTLYNVGIGTTAPTSKLTVQGDGKFTGVVTATSFYGDGTTLTGIANASTVASIQAQVNSLGTNLNIIGFYDALSGVVTSLTVVGQTRGYTGLGQTLASSGITTGDYFIVSTGGSNVGIATYTSVGITSVYPGDWIVGVGNNNWSIISYSQQVVAPRATKADVATTLELNSNVNTSGIITASSFNRVGGTSGQFLKADGSVDSNQYLTTTGSGINLSGIVTSIVAGTGVTISQTAGSVTINASGGGGGISTSASYADNAGIATYASNSGISTYSSIAGIATYTSEWTLGASGTDHYIFTGPGFAGGENDPTLYLVRGQQYKIINSMGMHPFRIQNAINGAVGPQYNDGIVGNDLTSGTLTWNVQFDTPSVLYYQCTTHPNMGGKINILSDVPSYSETSGSSTYSTLSGVSTNVIGGIASVSQLSVSGITTLGTVSVSGDVNVVGVLTATTLYGNILGSITNATNLTGGTANASSLNVSGVATISQGRIQVNSSSNIRIGNLPVGSGSIGRNIAIGDQVLTSLSGGQGRNIAIGELSYYDTTSGQYNIGIGERSGQKIGTGSYNVIIGSYDGNSSYLDITNSSNNLVLADGQGNIRLYANPNGNIGIKTTVVTEALTVAGIVSATGFHGTLKANQLTGVLPVLDGSNLFGVTATGSGVQIRDDNAIVGTAATIDFGSNLSVTFASGIATITAPSSVNFATSSGTATVAQGLTGTPNITVNNANLNQIIIPQKTQLTEITSGNYSKTVNFGNDLLIFHLNDGIFGKQSWILADESDLHIGTRSEGDSYNYQPLVTIHPANDINPGSTAYVSLGYGEAFPNTKLRTVGYGISITGGINATGIITASSFSGTFNGSGSGLTNIPSSQLTGSLPAIDGSQLLNITASGTGIVVRDENVTVGSAVTVNFGTGLDVTFGSGIATVTAAGASLKSRTIVSGTTASLVNNATGNVDINGFRTYSLMKVGLSTAGWIRLYTDSTSRTNDASRSVGEDPAPGSGVIAEVVTTGISTTQIISPFVLGGNIGESSSDIVIYAAITNLSGTTQAITANLTILQLEA